MEADLPVDDNMKSVTYSCCFPPTSVKKLLKVKSASILSLLKRTLSRLYRWSGLCKDEKSLYILNLIRTGS